MLDREQLIEDLANQACEYADMKTLIQFYYDEQISYFSSLTDEELLEYIEDSDERDSYYTN